MTRRVKELFLISVSSMGVVWMTAGVVRMIREETPVAHVLLVFIFGTATLGPVLFPLVWLLFRHKAIKQAHTSLLLIAAPVGVFVGIVGNDVRLLSTGVFVVVAILTAESFLMPSVALVAGKCFRCGYDLTGNRSGRCPECGLLCQESRRLQVEGTSCYTGASSRHDQLARRD